MDDRKNKKKFIIPEAEKIDFVNDDIITESLTESGESAGWEVPGGTDWWG